MTAIWKEDRILLIRNSYKKGWSLPGGILSRGETWKQAAAREVFEEVGLYVKEEDLAFMGEIAGDLGPRDRAYLFEVEMDGSLPVKIDGREVVEAEFVEPEDALRRSLNAHVKSYVLTRIG